MEDLKTNKMLWILLSVTIFNVAIFLLGNYVIDKTALRVIHKLQKDYSPSPYGPGFDLDKVSPEGFKSINAQFEQRDEIKTLNQPVSGVVELKPRKNIVDLATNADIWRNEWEQDRGFNPVR